MNLPRVQVNVEEWPADRWLMRSDPLGDKHFVLIEGDPSHPEDEGEGPVIVMDVVIGGGFTTANLAKVLRGLAQKLDEQAQRPAA